MPNEWDRKKAAIAGALVGATYAYYDTPFTADTPERIGHLIGGAAAVGMIFLLVAVAQNWIVRAR